jgi:ABC-type phosphate transport system substrate-binding protein
MLNALCAGLLAAEYAVISNKNIKSLTKEKAKAIFLRKLVMLDDSKIIPVNLSPRDSVRNSFEKKVIGMSFNRLKSYWTKQHYLGHRPPLTMKSQQSILAFIKKVDGAIGYVDLDNVDDDVKILYRWSD